MSLFNLAEGSGIWGTGMLPPTSLTGTPAPTEEKKPEGTRQEVKTFGGGSLAGDPVKPEDKNAYERKLIQSMVSRPLPGSTRSLGQAVKESATRLGVDPDFVAASFLGEGDNLIYGKEPATSDAYAYAVKKGRIDPNVYKTDAFFAAGMDDAERDLNEAKKKGYLPQDMDYKHYEAINEAVQKNHIAETDPKTGRVTKYKAPKELVDRWLKKDSTDEEWEKANDDMQAYLKEKKVPLNQTVAFKSYDDMVAAKTAVMKSMQDKIEAAAAKRNIKLTAEEKNYLMASGYNGGFGTATMLLDEVAKGNKDALKSGIPAKKQVHNNIQQRLRWTGYIKKK